MLNLVSPCAVRPVQTGVINRERAAAQPVLLSLFNSSLQTDTISFSGSKVHDIPPGPMRNYRKRMPGSFKDLIRTVAYMQTQTFRQERQDVLDAAKSHLQELLDSKPSPHIAIAMDLDETLLDNTSAELQKLVGPGSNGNIHREWRQSGDCPSIPETLEFFRWVRNVIWTDNQGQNHRGVPVFFVTARRTVMYDPKLDTDVDLTQQTIDNLNKIGITPDDYTGLYLRPSTRDTWERSGDFKERKYNEIEVSGHQLVMVVADMDHDFQGFTGYRAQLPNPLHID